MRKRSVLGAIAGLVVIAAALSLCSPEVWGCAIIVPPIPPRPIPEPEPQRLVVEQQRVEAQISDQVAVTEVTTVVANPHRRQLEGTFIFVLPDNAAVGEFALYIDGKPVEGELLDKDKASELYLDIVRKLKDPSLLEYTGHGVFKCRIFPVPPKGERKVRLSYSQVLQADGGLVKYVYPFQLPEDEKEQRGGLVVSAEIESRVPLKSVYSPTHKIDVVRDSDHKVRVSLEEEKADFDGDFVLYYTLAEADFGLNMLAHREEGDAPGYFLLLLSPKQEWAEQEIVAKDVIFVFDSSGSMEGEKIEQAREALKYCLKSLNPRDRFGLASFATGVRKLDDRLLAVEDENLERARKFVDGIEAAGGTAVDEALLSALAMVDHDSGRPAMVIFLTDGRPTVGEDNIEKILEHVSEANKVAGSHRPARLFVFGVGHKVNTHLLDELAVGNGGTSVYVKPEEEIDRVVSSFYTKVSHPVLSDLEVELGEAEAHDLYPRRMPDLFKGSQLVMVGRYDGTGDHAVRLRGKAKDRSVELTYEFEYPRREGEHAFLPRLWAVRHVGYLLDQLRLGKEDEDELKDEIIKLSLKYGIVTPYTSYLVREDRPEARELAALPVGRAAAGAGGSFAMPPAQTEAAGEGLRGSSGPAAVHAADTIGAMKSESATEARAARMSYVGSKTFYFDGATWIDSEYDAELPRIKIAYASEAYGQLLGAAPQAAGYLALGQSVKFRLGDICIEVGSEGAERLTDRQLREIAP
jgi:Ca-activated chloride channel family protein